MGVEVAMEISAVFCPPVMNDCIIMSVSEVCEWVDMTGTNHEEIFLTLSGAVMIIDWLECLSCNVNWFYEMRMYGPEDGVSLRFSCIVLLCLC